MFQHSLIKPSILTLNLSPKSLGALRCFSSLMLLITAPKILLWEEVMVGGHGGGQEEPVANLDTSTLLHCLSCHPPWFSCSRFAWSCCQEKQSLASSSTSRLSRPSPRKSKLAVSVEPFLAPFPMVWLCSAPISETILASETWKGAAAQGFVYHIGASGFFLKHLDRLGTLTPIVKPLTTKSSFGLTSSWGTGACFGSEDHELKWHHPWTTWQKTKTEWHLYLQKKMNFYVPGATSQ